MTLPQSNYRCIMILLLLPIKMCPVSGSNAHFTSLVNYLFTDYLKEIRPAYNHLEATKAFLSMSLTAIDDLDERNQILVSSVVIGIEYFDEYLSWNQSTFGGIQSLIYPQSELWLPDLVVENSVEKMGQLGYDEMTMTIHNSGKVIWRPKAVLRTTCSIDVTYYPFDTQTCSIILSTWTSGSEDIRLNIDTSKLVRLDRYQESGAWDLITTSIHDASGSSSQNRISFNFTIRRRKTYYVLNLIVPVIALCATASLVFGLPAEAGEKIGMSITVLLAYAVYLTIISESMPKTSLQVSVMGVYLSILLTATALAVVFTVFVLDIHHRDDELPPGKKWRYFTYKLRPLIGLHDLRRGIVLDDPVVDLQETPQKTSKILSIFKMNKVAHADDKVNFKENKLGQSQCAKKAFKDVVMETDATPKLLWRHVAETVDRFLFVLFTSFTAVSSVIFVCLLTFGTP